MSNEEFISINKVAEAKGLKSNRSLRLEINKPESKYIAREVKVNSGTSYEILYSSLEPEIQKKLREGNTKSTSLESMTQLNFTDDAITYLATQTNQFRQLVKVVNKIEKVSETNQIKELNE